MKILDKKYCLPTHPTWEVIDTSKLNCYLDCPRKFFWQYVLGWSSTAPNNHLVFGEAMHRALAYMMQTDYSDKNIMVAYNEKFLPYYREHFSESTDELMGGKTPTALFMALGLYASKYKHDQREFKVHHVEVAGVAPISPTRSLHLRIDAICEDEQGFFNMEHKSGGNLNRMWTDQWDLHLQPTTYTHALHCAYPDQPIRGTMINGLFFRLLKRTGPKIEFARLPMWKNKDNMIVWLSTVNSVMDDIEADFEMLSRSSDTDSVLQAFRLNPGSCVKFAGCSFRHFCAAWPNPLRRCQEPQTGYEVSFWDPRELEAQYQLSDIEAKEHSFTQPVASPSEQRGGLLTDL